MKVHIYDSYDEYVEAQIAGNKKTSDWVWVQEQEIEAVARILKEKKKSLDFGICHGVRTGAEQRWFEEYLEDVEVIGTDIAAADTPGVLEWDFHDIKPEWEGNVDFIYSNSFDHTCEPEKCLSQWMRCLKPDGYCILHWSEGQEKSTRRDPFGASLEDYKDLIRRGGYELEDVSELGDLYERDQTRTLLWIQNRTKTKNAFTKNLIGHTNDFRSICEVLREIYWATENPEIRFKAIEASGMAKKMSKKLARDKYNMPEGMEYEKMSKAQKKRISKERWAQYLEELERGIDHPMKPEDK